MNYPVWHVAFGSGLLMALVATLHVFVSHFAVGGGLFLVVTERRARRTGDLALLGWLRAHTKFFVLVTVVFGAISGVGIWFTIGLISPTATSNLIHAYVWGWAIEWVFFFLEISAALFYLYGWDKLEPRVHEWFGWIYFVNAYASLVIINGIITFMLTSGTWVKDHQFWSGFFNPTYFPSLALRSAIALALAGVYASITASVQKDLALKARLVRWSAWWTVPSLALLVPLAYWYIRQVPATAWASARGGMPTATGFAVAAAALLAVTLALTLLALVRPARMHLAFSLVVAVAAFGAMASFEMVREAIRKPFVIANYLYANSVYSADGPGGYGEEAINQKGILQTARWVSAREPTGGGEVAAGAEVFRTECESCHSRDGYRGVKRYLALRRWDRERIQAMLGGLGLMHNGAMPAFVGTEAERAALAAYLSTVEPVSTEEAAAASDGATLFGQNCSMCHRASADDPLFQNLARDPGAAVESLKDLTSLFPLMPSLKLSDQQRAALVQWIDGRRGEKGFEAQPQGGSSR
ncbi:MAG TPA: c-type cytochrome [Anaeromyxobacter sp.]|nr:c-type cytochrome [Anaeromyxobacter sp.]